jgi:hypothetical protein
MYTVPAARLTAPAVAGRALSEGLGLICYSMVLP